MTRRLPLPSAAPWLAAAWLLLAPGGAAGQATIAPAPVPGPVGLSVGNESRIALIRAERWLEHHAPPDADAPSRPAPPPATDDEIDRLLPLLQGDTSPLAENEFLCEALERLAAGLALRGESRVFLPDGTSLPWRNAILHALVSSQRPDDQGGGWWGDGPDDALRQTQAAHAALLFLMGEAAP